MSMDSQEFENLLSKADIFVLHRMSLEFTALLLQQYFVNLFPSFMEKVQGKDFQFEYSVVQIISLTGKKVTHFAFYFTKRYAMSAS